MLATVIALCLTATACGSPATARLDASSSSAAPGTGSAGPREWVAQEKANRAKAESDARLLLARAEIPPGSVELTSAPAALPGPALGSNQADTSLTLTNYWRVPLSFPVADAFVKQHPPAGLSEMGAISGGSLAAKIQGRAWAGGGSGPSGQLHIGLASIGDGSAADEASYLRVDALTEWQDPRPIPDEVAGARMRIEAGDRCPADNKGVVGVGTKGEQLADNLAPADKPKAGLLCSYAGLSNDQPFTLSRQRVLSAAAAARVAEAARRADLSHSGGMRSCPGMDNGVLVLVLEYPSRPAVNLWLRFSGCPSASNGSIRAVDRPSLAALREVVDALSD
jgi:hypothetical protein